MHIKLRIENGAIQRKALVNDKWEADIENVNELNALMLSRSEHLTNKRALEMAAEATCRDAVTDIVSVLREHSLLPE